MFGDERVPVEAIKAGVDMMLMPPDLDLAYNAVLDAVDSGEIGVGRINESVHRILSLKLEQGLFEDPYVDVSKVSSEVGTPEHLAVADEITDKTITLVKNDEGVLPLEADAGQDVLVTGWGVSSTQTLAAGIRRAWRDNRGVRDRQQPNSGPATNGGNQGRNQGPGGDLFPQGVGKPRTARPGRRSSCDGDSRGRARGP